MFVNSLVLNYSLSATHVYAGVGYVAGTTGASGKYLGAGAISSDIGYGVVGGVAGTAATQGLTFPPFVLTH